jgi:nucleotide-binding universal stress UspA family protein
MFKTIVVGVDGREGGRDALSLAARLALMAGGELVAVRAIPLDQYVVRAGAPKVNTLAEAEAERMLAEELTETGITARTRVVSETSPAHALHRVAEEVRADVIVVGSTHHGAVGRVFAGDDAAATLHGSTRPVAIAPHGLAAREWRPVSHIGVGLDDGPEAANALALAAALARDSGATLALRSVVGDADATVDGGDWLDRARTLATSRLEHAVAGLPVAATSEVTVGSPVAELAELSRSVDLLVVGSRAWGPVRRVVLGSTAAELMRRSHCPVLVQPRGADPIPAGEDDSRGSFEVAHFS